MKVAVPAKGKGLDAEMEKRFGRSHYFVLVDLDTLDCETIVNTHREAPGGAGVQAAQLLAERDVEAVVVCNVGPKALRVLASAGINVYEGAGGSVREVVEKFKAGQLKMCSGTTVQSHYAR